MKTIITVLMLIIMSVISGCGFVTDEITAARMRGAEAGLHDRTMRPACPRKIPEWWPLRQETSATLEAYRAAYLETCSRK